MTEPRQCIYKGKVVHLWLERVVLPNGHEVTLEVIRHPGAAAVVPLHESGDVTLIRQYRHAAGGFIWEIPAGKLDGEDPAVCALRELEEEAGLAAGRLTHLGWIFTTPGFTDEKIHLFLAEELSPATQKLEHDEVLTCARYPLQQALAMVARGEIVDAKSALALFLTAEHLRHRDGGAESSAGG
ncbi:MAG: ADP-ribose pyrophosphatase [Candidatus Binatia bacterium]|nr:MAG: ADP-ribose pyrophosphatase [Candidatus Binatia bacterium]